MTFGRRLGALGILLLAAACGGGGGGGAVVLVVAPGTLDPSFHGTGLVTGVLVGPDAATDVVVLPDGRIVVVGTSPLILGGDFFAARFLPDGSPDTSFGFGGVHVVDFGGDDVCVAVALQADGKVVLAGYTDSGVNVDFAVARLNADGTPDTTFNASGRFTFDPSAGGKDQALDVLVQPDQKIVVVGAEDIGAGADFGVLRLDTAGTPDVTFGGGYVTRDFGGEDVAHAVRRDPTDGSLVVAGSTDFASANDFALCRFSALGIYDIGFGDRLVGFWPDDQATDVQIQGDGKILVSGTVDGGLPDFGVARLNAGGTLDTTYNDVLAPTAYDGDGRLSFTFGTPPFGGTERCNHSLLLADGRLLLVGQTDAGGGVAPNTAIARVTTSGTLDTTFSDDGRQVFDLLGTSFEAAVAAAQAPDGKVIVVGFAGGRITVLRIGS